jgi:Mrp family chromosome partitioning ATPase/capsular polysaccharide biosynthesis protein
MQPLDIVTTLRRRWPVVAVCFALALVVALPGANDVSTQVSTPYVSQSTVVVDLEGSIPIGQVMALTTGEVTERVATELDLPGGVARLREAISVEADEPSGLITFTATYPDPATATLIADTLAGSTLAAVEEQQVATRERLATSLGETLNSLRSELDEASAALAASPDDIVLKANRDGLRDREKSIIQRLRDALAVIPGQDVSVLREATVAQADPSAAESGLVTPLRRSVLLALLGLAVGVLAALGFERFDPRPHRREDLEAAFRMRTLAVVPYGRGRRRGRHATEAPARATEPRTLAAFRTLRSALLVTRPYPLLDSAGDRPGELEPPASRQRVVLVASVRDGQAATVVSAGLVAALTESGTRVLAIDGDHLSGRLSAMLGLGDGPGFVDMLQLSSVRPDVMARAVQLSTGEPRIAALPAGVASDYPGASPERVRAVLEAACHFADVVVIDGAPILDAVQSLDLLPVVDGVLMVATAGEVLRDEAEQAAEILDNLGAKAYGLVLLEPAHRRVSARPSRATVRPEPPAAEASRVPSEDGDVSRAHEVPGETILGRA